MFCIHCGKQIPDESKFCQYCGKALTIESSEPEQQELSFSSTKPSIDAIHHHFPEKHEESLESTSTKEMSAKHQTIGIVCPKCGSSNLKVERFTWWGGVLGAALANRMVCKNCGNKFKLNK